MLYDAVDEGEDSSNAKQLESVVIKRCPLRFGEEFQFGRYLINITTPVKTAPPKVQPNKSAGGGGFAPVSASAEKKRATSANVDESKDGDEEVPTEEEKKPEGERRKWTFKGAGHYEKPLPPVKSKLDVFLEDMLNEADDLCLKGSAAGKKGSGRAALDSIIVSPLSPLPQSRTRHTTSPRRRRSQSSSPSPPLRSAPMRADT